MRCMGGWLTGKGFKMTVRDMFKKRTYEYYRRIGKYLKYVFNDHFVIALMILTGALGFTYSDYVETVAPSDLLPRLLLIVIIYSVLPIGGIRTLIEPADGIYLLPLEKQMAPIMRRHLLVSGLFLSAGMAVIATLTMPLMGALDITGRAYSLSWLAVLICLKLIDLLVQFHSFQSDSLSLIRTINIGRHVLILGTLGVSLFLSLWTGLILALAGFLGLLYLVFSYSREKLWNWDRMIDVEQKRVQGIYRLINLFIETPYGQNKVKRMKGFDPLISIISSKTDPHMYYISRVFIRQTAFSGLYVRLLAIGLIVIFFTPILWLRTLVSVLFIYLIGFQLLPLKQVLDESVHFKLYPYTNTDKIKAIQKLLNSALIVTSIIFSLGSLNGGWETTGIVFLISTLFVFGFNSIYVPKRLG